MRNKTISFRSSLLLVWIFLLFFNSCNKDKVPSLTTNEVTEIARTTATSGGKITDDGGNTITECGVCWSTSQNPTIYDFKTKDGAGSGSFTSNIIGLYPYTTYYVRAYATNSNGTGYGSSKSFTTQGSAFTDLRDGNVYKTVTIGNQEWMAENLRYLPTVVWANSGSPDASYNYVYDYYGFIVTDAKASKNYPIYGVLYNWSAAMNGVASSTANPSGIQGACPNGWHLPSDAEWTQLTTYLGGESVAADKLKEIGSSHWNGTYNESNNETGFTALPGGYRDDLGIFDEMGKAGIWWTATGDNDLHACARSMNYYESTVDRGYHEKRLGFSVRCVKN
jgi:uncharacterized protein (TIGR02145 family)